MVRNLWGCAPRPADPGKCRRAVWVQHSARLTPITHGDIMTEATERTTKTPAAPPPTRRGLLAAGRATSPSLPPVLPRSAEEQAASAEITAQLQALTAIFHQRNLESAVRLAGLAASRKLPKELEDHFAELGRRYAHVRGDSAEPAKATGRAKPAKAKGGLRLVVNNGAEVTP